MFDNTLLSPIEYKDYVNSLVDKNKDRLKLESDDDALTNGTDGSTAVAKHATVVIPYVQEGGLDSLKEEFTQMPGEFEGSASEIVGREYYEFGPNYYSSPSGLYAFTVRHLKKLTLKDGSGKTYTFEFALDRKDEIL